MKLTLIPSLDPGRIRADLERLLVSGPLCDPDLQLRAERLDRRYRAASRHCPAPLWAPGLRIDPEWRAVTESYHPWQEIAPVFRRLISRSLRYAPPSDPLNRFPGWGDFLQRCSPPASSANPARMVSSLLADEDLRRCWLFTLFLPKEHGGGFDRYPEQQGFVRQWLERRRQLFGGRVSCLDAACGTGEGTWELAALCRESGFVAGGVTIIGSSLDPLELCAAAHALFPHDLPRQRQYRARLALPAVEESGERLRFERDDLTAPEPASEEHDLVLCNGLIGGPMLHDPGEVATVLAGLARRLRPGGVFVAADRFHGGWRKRWGGAAELLAGCGMRLLEIGEGIAAEKPLR